MGRQANKRISHTETRLTSGLQASLERWTPTSPDPPCKLVCVSPEYHDVSIAVSAGILLLGAGQLYNGQTAKGSVLVALALVGAVLMALQARNPVVVVLGLAIGVIVYTVTIIDAGVIAGRLIRCEPVRPWEWLWSRRPATPAADPRIERMDDESDD